MGNKKINRKRVVLRIVFYIIIISLLYYFTKNNISNISKIKEITFDYLFYSSVFISITLILLGLKTKLIVNHYNISLSKTEWLGLGIINTFWNYLFLKGGVVARAVYLKKKGLAYSDFSSIIIVTHIISLMLFSFLSFIVFILASFYFHISLLKIIIFFLVIFIAMVLSLKGSIKTKNKILQIFIKNKEDIRKNRLLISKLIILEFIIIIIYSLRLKIIGDFFDYDLPYIAYFLIALFSNISMNILNLVPGGLGIKEAGSGFILKILNFNLEYGIIITLIDRVIAMSIIFPVGLLFNFILFKTIYYNKIKT
ncbi:MAG: lysylphosphatidylglycerol synthase domain-containing protein [Patescibacteria group bacterium]|nr:lysylphosphatidylglycerol synthase domain-containing protein [Patescibacteria group bacterium]